MKNENELCDEQGITNDRFDELRERDCASIQLPFAAKACDSECCVTGNLDYIDTFKTLFNECFDERYQDRSITGIVETSDCTKFEEGEDYALVTNTPVTATSGTTLFVKKKLEIKEISRSSLVKANGFIITFNQGDYASGDLITMDAGDDFCVTNDSCDPIDVTREIFGNISFSYSEGLHLGVILEMSVDSGTTWSPIEDRSYHDSTMSGASHHDHLEYHLVKEKLTLSPGQEICTQLRFVLKIEDSSLGQVQVEGTNYGVNIYS